MSLRAIEPRRLYRQVADQIRELIASGAYATGDRLPTERELSERLGVSRPTVREALIALEVEGYVRIRVGSGIYVTRTSGERPAAIDDRIAEGPFEILRARELVESAVAGEAAALAGEADLARLDETLARMAAGPHPSATAIALDRAFHVAVVASLGNAVLERLVGELFDQRMTPYFARLSHYFETDESWRLAHAEHMLVRDAIAAGDRAGATAAMRSHLQASQSRFQTSFGEADPKGRASGTETEQQKKRQREDRT